MEEGSKPPVNKGGKLVTWRPQLAPPRCLQKVSLEPPSTFWGSLGGQGAVCLTLTVGSRPRGLPCLLMRFSSFFFPIPSHHSLRGYSMPCTVPAV